MEVGQGVTGKRPPPIAEVSATELPSPAARVVEMEAMEGGACWLGVWLLLLGSSLGGDGGDQPCSSEGGASGRGVIPQAGIPASTDPAAA